MKRFFLPLIFLLAVLSGCSYYEGYKYCKANPEICEEPAKAEAKEMAKELEVKIRDITKPLIENAVANSGIPAAGVASKASGNLGSYLVGAAGGAVAFPFLSWFFMGKRGRRLKDEADNKSSD